MKQQNVTLKIEENSQLTPALLRDAMSNQIKLVLGTTAIRAISHSRAYLDEVVAKGQKIYGVNTGFGKLAQVEIAHGEQLQLQRNLIFSHAAGVGKPMPVSIVRLILLLKIQSLARGCSGVSLPIVHFLVELFNRDFLPIIPRKGSVGASGDLAPLAHIGLILLGLGQLQHKNETFVAASFFAQNEIETPELQPKDGLALINGTQASTALAIAASLDIERIFNAALFAGAMTTVSTGGSLVPFDARLQEVRGQRGQILIAKKYREIFQNLTFPSSHRVQDPYCLRCQPQVMGAVFEQMNYVQEILIREANGISDNPLIFPDSGQILNGGNFHAEPIALAADALAVACAEIASLSERRTAFLMDAHWSGLPAFLAAEPGLQAGFMIAQTTTAALVSENKTLAHPASVDSIPTSANQEDHVSMATFGAQRLHAMAANSAYVVAIELLAACQAVDLATAPLSVPLKKIYDKIREHSHFYCDDRSLSSEIEKIAELILHGDFEEL